MGKRGPKKQPNSLSYHSLYYVYRNMLSRCHYPESKDFYRYGGRGIVVCDRWRAPLPRGLCLFIEDVEKEIGPRPLDKFPSGHPLYTIDRINNDGNYEPGN